MCEQGRLGRRALFLAGGAIAAVGAIEAFLPSVAFAESTDGTADQTRTVTGRFEPGAPDWYYLPVEVPSGVREIEVVYSYDRPQVPPGAKGNALDFGVFGPEGHELGNHRGFRGWSGGFRDRFTISASSATPGYLAGPIERGTWHVILGPYTVAPQGMNYRVDITLRFGEPGPKFVSNPAPTRAKGRGRAWYRGDGHLHTVYSDGHRTPTELAAAARAAGLDWIISTEHNTPAASHQWGEHAGDDLLIVNGEEVTTRSGHWPAWGLPVGRWIDWRYRANEPGEFRRFVDEVHSVGGLVVAAHPNAPCLGCSWEFRYSLVDAIEVWNGPWTLDDELSVQAWDKLLRDGRWVPAVGDSDAHNPAHVVGLPHNVVHAEDLAVEDILHGLKSGRTWLAESAAVQLDLRAEGRGGRLASIGQRLHGGPGTPVDVVITVGGVPGCAVRLLTPAGVAHTEQVPASGSATVRWSTTAKDTPWVRAEVRRPVATDTTPDTMVALTNPIFLGRAHHAKDAAND
ncbi:phosphoesterase [Solihabitans fulvus]|uniref:Phosphoesterase n=1 Tax=Solihabitans fulvus TaxID=1892852 RepID=A0A5B2XFY2_9PSEU|nr:CehA/McbA family metallohydrolase [Solihabitans fulvus]KAA2262253.1 phosphoesterase [Solihabitans fulvus]